MAEWAAILRVRDDLDSLTALSEQRPEPRVFLQLACLHARHHDAEQAKLAWCRAEAAGHRGPDRLVIVDIGRLDPEWAAQRWRDWAADHTISPLELVHGLDALGLLNEAITECRACLDQAGDAAAGTLLTLYDKRGDDEATLRALNELPDLEQVKYHPTLRQLQDTQPTSEPDDIRVIAARLQEAGDLDALRRHGAEHRDKVVLRHLTELLLERGHEEEVRVLIETSTGANRAYTAFLVREARWHDLAALVAESSATASHRTGRSPGKVSEPESNTSSPSVTRQDGDPVDVVAFHQRQGHVHRLAGGRKPKLTERQVTVARQIYEEKGDEGKRHYTVAEDHQTFHVSRKTIYRHLEPTTAIRRDQLDQPIRTEWRCTLLTCKSTVNFGGHSTPPDCRPAALTCPVSIRMSLESRPVHGVEFSRRTPNRMGVSNTPPSESRQVTEAT